MTRSPHLAPALGLAAATLAIFPPASPAQQTTPASAPLGRAAPVEVTAQDYAFQAPDAIPSGWTTIRFTNDGEEPHFVFMSRLPEGRTIEQYETELSPAFARAWYAVRDAQATTDEALEALFQELPEWFAELEMVGGPGLAAPGRTTETVLNLEPGNYVIECYVKTAEGEIHYMEGMVRPLLVREERSAESPPTPDITVTLSNNQMTVEGDLTPGRRTVAVRVAENPEVGFGHSAHLARLDADVAVDDIVAWMNWFAVGGLSAPAPAEFIGGVHFMPEGETAYFTADLEPGRYLLVSESTGHLGVLEEFTVR